MKVIVLDERRRFSRQTRAYAEYRAFSGLAGTGGLVDDVTVALTAPAGGGDESASIVCSIAVSMKSGACTEVAAAAHHACAAIDRAVSLMRQTPLFPTESSVATRRASPDREDDRSVTE